MNFCSNCGSKLNPGQAVCLSCGFAVKSTAKNANDWNIETSTGKNRVTTLLITFFLGTFGAHWFYLGNYKRAWITLFVALSGFLLIVPLLITSVLAIVNLVQIVALDNTEEFDKFSGLVD